MVERFTGATGMIAAKDGTFIRHSDYAKLEAENERLKHRSFLARLAAYFDASDLASSFMPEDGDGGFLAAIHRMTQEISSLRAQAISRTGAVKVTRTDILREWFGGDRYARDHEYLDANYSRQADQVVAYLSALEPAAPEA